MNLDTSKITSTILAGLLTAGIIANIQAYSVLSTLSLTVQYIQERQVVMERRLDMIEGGGYE